MDYFLLGLEHGWTWQEWCDTPDVVRTLCWTYAQARADVRSDQA